MTFVGARPELHGNQYRVWAPDHHQITLLVTGADGVERLVEMARDASGHFTAFDELGRDGDLYLYELQTPSGPERRPDPASRFQPRGVHGPSQCVDSTKYQWRADWRRPGWHGQVTYELHIGTFTEEGTFAAAISRLDDLKALGIEAIEIMPIGDFAGERNWGYDGVAIYAPARVYGQPDDLRRLIDEAHLRGLSVILDVVYNHLGPSGSQHRAFSRSYFHVSRATPWGVSLNFDGADSRPVRDFFVGNARYWLDDFRFDGLRLDATHAIEDSSEIHLVSEIVRMAHERGAFVIAEDERNDAKLLNPQTAGGYGLDAVWSDDFHHQVRVATTGLTTGYFSSYRGTPAEIAHTLENGWFFTGQSFPFWAGKPRGSDGAPFDSRAFIYCIENHDQVGNRPLAERLSHLTTPEQFRAATALLCLGPHSPMIFMGQEWAASSPFHFFTDHEAPLGKQVTEGRAREFATVGWNVDSSRLSDPQQRESFLRSKLNWAERALPAHRAALTLYRECLAARKWVQPFLSATKNWSVQTRGDLISIRYADKSSEVILVVCLGSGDFDLQDRNLKTVLHTEESRFGGNGQPGLQFSRPGAALLSGGF